MCSERTLIEMRARTDSNRRPPGSKSAAKGYTSVMNEETLEQIQTKIAFLERAASELSDVVFRQHTEIQAIEAKLSAIADRLSRAESSADPRPPAEERPPHY
jgi:SlyX protein